MLGSALAHVGNFLGHGGGRLAPGEVGINVLGRQLVRRLRGTTEVQRRVRLLHRREEVAPLLDLEVLACKVHRLARKQAAPDGQKLIGVGVALIVRQVDAIGGQLGGIAAGHDVEQQAPFQRLIERGGLARAGHRCAQRGAQRHQQLDALGDGRQAGRRHPGVEAGAAGGNEQAVVAQAFCGDGNLPHVFVGGGAAKVRGAQVAGVTRGGQEPEDVGAGSGAHGKFLAMDQWGQQGTLVPACRHYRRWPRPAGRLESAGAYAFFALALCRCFLAFRLMG